jgi:hypothetical protein
MRVVAKRNGTQFGTSLTAIANQKIVQQMQSQIHPEIYIYYNSKKLLLGQRESGKTYNVIREIIKICLLDQNGGYTSFVIISDKPNY